MLAAITLMLSQCTSPEMAVPAAIVLHGLKELCCAEVSFTHTHTQNQRLESWTLFVLQVVDILSTWRTLGPRLSSDTRTPMVQASAELLALVPQLSVQTEEHQVAQLLQGAFPETFSCPSVVLRLR